MNRASSIRRQLVHVLDLLGMGQDPYAPREIVVAIALRDDVSVETVIERLGVDLSHLDPADLDGSAIPFADLEAGTRFERGGSVWTKASLDTAVSSAADRAQQRMLVNAYATAVRAHGVPNAFRLEPGSDDSPDYVVSRFSGSVKVLPVP